jgi:hypothetical protein
MKWEAISLSVWHVLKWKWLRREKRNEMPRNRKQCEYYPKWRRNEHNEMTVENNVYKYQYESESNGMKEMYSWRENEEKKEEMKMKPEENILSMSKKNKWNEMKIMKYQ